MLAPAQRGGEKGEKKTDYPEKRFCEEGKKTSV